MILRVRALELDNERLSNLLNVTPQAPYDPSTRSDDDLAEDTFQNAQEWARRGVAAQKAVNKIMSQAEMRERAKKRPANFQNLSAKTRWEIDKSLGILDYEGD